MDLTTATLQELKARIAELPPGDEFNRISNRIAELELEERSKAAEQETVTNEVAKFMDSLDFEGVDPKDLFVNYTEEKAAASYGYVNAVIQSAVAKMKQAELANTNTLEATISALQEKYKQSEEANEQLNLELSNKTLEIADLNSRLTNATRMLGEEQAEVERLNSQVDDLRKEIAIGAAAASKVVEVDVRSTREIWEEERRKEEDAKPVIYNIRWKDDIRRDTYLAELAATDETIEIPYYAMNGDLKDPTAMKGRHRVVTSEEAPSFRTAAAVEEDHTSNVPVGSDLTLTVPAFRDDEDESPTEPGLAAEASTVAGSPVTREEFEELKARVAQIESIRSVA
jgi:hypothetical protein